MMTRPVAVTRALLVLGVVWLAGAVIVVGLFRATDTAATIDVQGVENRLQVVWLGAHAFVACLAAVLAVLLGASALTRVGIASPRSASCLVAVPVLLGGLGALVVLDLAGGLSAAMLVAEIVGLAIGIAGGTFFILLSGTPEEDHAPYAAGKRSGMPHRGWGSR